METNNKILAGLKSVGIALKQIFSDLEKEKPQAFETYVLKDGVTSVSIDKLEVGGVAKIGDQFAPKGEHYLADGSKIVIAGEDGVITEIELIKPTDEPIMSTEEEFKKAMQKFATGTPEERIARLETIVKGLVEYSFGWELREADRKASIDNALAAYKQNFETAQNEKVKQLATTVEQLFEVVKTIGEQPQQKPTEPTQNEPLTAWQQFQATRRNV